MNIYKHAMKNEKEQMGNLDVLRCVAALAVVCIHVVAGSVHSYNGELHTDLLKSLQTIQYFMKWSVPVFFIMTGYFCGKHASYPYFFALKKVKKFVLALITIGFFYALLECVFSTNHLGTNEITKAILNVLNGKLWDHMWFVYDIIGIYLVLPLLFIFFSKSDEQEILILFLFLFKILLPWVGKITIVNIDIKFPLSGYLFYVCYGMLFSACSDKRIGRRSQMIISIILILLGIIVPLFGIKQSDYTDLFVCFLAIGLFSLFIELHIPATKGLAVLAGCTWGVYLIHPFFINLAIKLLKINVLSGMVFGKLFIFYLAVVFVSFGCVYVLKHIPVIRILF